MTPGPEMSPHWVYLASRSPRRRELLDQIGVAHRVVAVAVAEAREPGEAPEDYARRVAADKARAGWVAAGQAAGRAVLGADTDVVLDDAILGKPRDAAHARTMLARLSGRRHRVLSAVAVAGPGGVHTRLSVTTVAFRPLSPREIEAYVASGEPLDKAGAYGIQGRAGAFAVALEGSYSGVVGLPLCETVDLLREAGVSVMGEP